MIRKTALMLAIALMVMGGAMAAGPATSEALTISSISVTVGGVTFCDVNNNNAGQGCGGGAFHIWDLTGGQNLGNGGIALVLAQNQPGVPDQGAFNFDTSEGNGRVVCNSPGACTTSMFINGVAVPLSAATTANSALANFNVDPGGTAHNEASNWGSFVADTGPGGYRLWFGYADNAHSGACADTTGSVASTCRPDFPWLGELPPGGTSTIFLGSAAGSAGAGGCVGGIAPCFDSGAIRIEANPVTIVPEPASIFLLGIGLMGLAAWGRKRSQA
jgi:hypothetical protein